MKILLRQALRPLVALAVAVAACAPVSAVMLPFDASYSGDVNVVEVIDATVPVLRFRTFANGVGSFDLVRYFSPM